MAVSDANSRVYLTREEVAALAEFLKQTIETVPSHQLFSIKATADERIDRIIVCVSPGAPVGVVRAYPLMPRNPKRT